MGLTESKSILAAEHMLHFKDEFSSQRMPCSGIEATLWGRE